MSGSGNDAGAEPTPAAARHLIEPTWVSEPTLPGGDAQAGLELEPDCHIEVSTDHRPQVSEAELTLAEEDEATRLAAENLHRRLADTRLRDLLAAVNYEGPAYELFAQELAAYGLAICNAWLITGEMFHQCALRGYRIGQQPHHWTEHDRTSLADDTVADALREFREKGLRGGGWRLEGGASLKTYFVTACVYAFLNTYRSWRKEQARWSRAMTFDPADLELFDAPSQDHVSQHALVKVEAQQACSDKSDYQRRVLLLRGLGYTHAEIAEVLGKNVSAIERALGRMRRSAERTGAGERGTSS